jgi:YVTN family beta-propeller protein
MLVSNPQPRKSVSLNRIAIEVPTGDSSDKLTVDGAGVTCSIPKPYSNIWGSSGTSEDFSVTPLDGNPVAITDQGLQIDFTVAQVNSSVGRCDLKIREFTTSSTAVAKHTEEKESGTIPADTTLPIDKYLDTFFLGNFQVVGATQVEPGSAVNLSWDWKGDPQYLTLTLTRNDLHPDDRGQPGNDPSHPGRITYDAAAGTYPNPAANPPDSLCTLMKNVTFTLRADINDRGNMKFVQDQVSVTVFVPAIHNPKPATDKLYLGASTELTWTTDYVDYCSIYVNLASGKQKVIADNLKPQEDGVYRYTVTPQQTTTYWVEGYGKESSERLVFEPVQPPVKVYQHAVTMPSIVGTGNCVDLAVTADGARLYAIDAVKNTVSVVDAKAPTPTVIGTISVGKWPNALALTADGAWLYVANYGDSTVSTVDLTVYPPKVVLPSAFLLWRPNMLALTADRSRLYAACLGYGKDNDSIIMLNAITDGKLDPTPSASSESWHDTLSDFAMAADGLRLYVANDKEKTVLVINAIAIGESLPVIFTVPVGQGPYVLALKTDGSLLYVANQNDNSVSVIDTMAQPPTVTYTLSVGKDPEALALKADGSRLYVANFTDNTVSVINTTAQPPTVTYTLSVGKGPTALALKADGSRLYVANFTDNTVSGIDTTLQIPVVIFTVAAGSSPSVLVLAADGSRLYATHSTQPVTPIAIDVLIPEETLTVSLEEKKEEKEEKTSTAVSTGRNAHAFFGSYMASARSLGESLYRWKLPPEWHRR